MKDPPSDYLLYFTLSNAGRSFLVTLQESMLVATISCIYSYISNFMVSVDAKSAPRAKHTASRTKQA
jgi:hypothetical protein